ncbi:MAG: hypothetical protein KDD53_12710, partial [Bdellovibrionales bacterium]|nr:hypothetical protein [Bdellovibrionales bacterium]
MKKTISLIAITLLGTTIVTVDSFAFPLWLKKPKAASQSVGIQDTSEQSSGIVASSNSKSKLNVSSDSSLGLYIENKYVPVVGLIKSDDQYYLVKDAKNKGVCGNGDAEAVTKFTKGIKKKQIAKLKVFKDDDNEVMYAGIKKLGKLSLSKTKNKLKNILDLTATRSVDTSCDLVGNASTLGIGGTNTQNASIGILEADDGDTDSDGMPDEFDADADGDGILNPYDSDSSVSSNAFQLFSNFKVSIESTL